MKQVANGVAMLALVFAAVACAAPPGVEPDSDAAEVVRVGAMSVPRAAHQATRLPDGRVLVTGGCTGRCDATLDSVEVFDPATARFSSLPSLAVARNSHEAVSLDDGRVLVLGGWSDRRITSSAELFNPATNRFERIRDMTVARAVPTAVKLGDGRVLVTGGQTAEMASLDSAEIFDPRTGGFAALPAMGSPRVAHTAVALADGRVLIAGGHSARRGGSLRSAEIFDPATGGFTATGDMVLPRHKHAAVLLDDGRVLVIGGAPGGTSAERFRSTEWFDPATGRFTPGPDMLAERYKLPDGVVLLPSGDVLVAAGDARVERYDAGMQRFVALSGEMDGRHEFATAVLLDGGDVLVLGGYGEQIRTTASAWRISLPATSGDVQAAAQRGLAGEAPRARRLAAGGYETAR